MVDNGLYFFKIIPGNLSMLTLDHFYFFNVGRNDRSILIDQKVVISNLCLGICVAFNVMDSVSRTFLKEEV